MWASAQWAGMQEPWIQSLAPLEQEVVLGTVVGDCSQFHHLTSRAGVGDSAPRAKEVI